MALIQFPISIPATNGSLPRLKFMVSTDSLSTITTAGYLNSGNLESAAPMSNNDVVMCLYSYNTQTTLGTFGIFTVTLSSSTGITLTAWSDTANVTLPTVVNQIIASTNTTGQLGNVTGTVTNAGSIQAGSNGVAGALSSFPGLANQGFLVIQANTNSAGNFHTEVTTETSIGQNQIILIPDSGQTSGVNFLLSAGVNLLGATGSIVATKVNGTEAANAVTASGMAGAITTSSLTTAGAGSYAITWTNTFISSTSTVLLTIAGGTNTTENITLKVIPGSGTATLTIYNNTAATALNGTIIISYLVF